MAIYLYAPKQYWLLTVEQKKEICNGCGPGKILDCLIPDTLWGLKITKACNIHDFMYYMGETIEDKKEADRVFLNNMLRIIRAKTKNSILMALRIRRAKKYYYAVDTFGGPFYWSGKNDLANIRQVQG